MQPPDLLHPLPSAAGPFQKLPSSWLTFPPAPASGKCNRFDGFRIFFIGKMFTLKRNVRMQMLTVFRYLQDFFNDFICLFLGRGEGREKGEKHRCERETSVVASHSSPKPATALWALPRNQTGGLSLRGMMPNQLSHTPWMHLQGF